MYSTLNKCLMCIFLGLMLHAKLCSGHAVVHIAVASNFAKTAKQVMVKFQEQYNLEVTLLAASTGKLYLQIMHGAPVDIFFAADARRPQLLIQDNLAVGGSEITYAIGKIALWAPGMNIKHTGAQFIQKTHDYFAIANSSFAPYGIAAKQTLLALKVLDKLKPKLVIGENVNQTFSFVATHAVAAGLVAYSQLVQYGGKYAPSSVWIVPEHYYTPITQVAVLLQRSKVKKSAQQVMKFFQQPVAKKIIQQAGYGVIP